MSRDLVRRATASYLDADFEETAKKYVAITERVEEKLQDLWREDPFYGPTARIALERLAKDLADAEKQAKLLVAMALKARREITVIADLVDL